MERGQDARRGLIRRQRRLGYIGGEYGSGSLVTELAGFRKDQPKQVMARTVQANKLIKILPGVS